jgi:RNA polymerase sigma factor (sigma-70 family)
VTGHFLRLPLSHRAALQRSPLSTLHDDEDAWLLTQLQRGSHSAFERVYASHKQALYGFLLRLCRDPNLAADLFQNTWLKLARYAAGLRDDTDLRAWLFTVARNEYRSHCRAQMLDLSRLLVLDKVLATEPFTEVPPDRELADIDAALAALDLNDREVLLLVCVEGLEPRQASAVIGISQAALRQRLARARKRLREELERSDELVNPRSREPSSRNP